jgi:pseudouridine kinase
LALPNPRHDMPGTPLTAPILCFGGANMDRKICLTGALRMGCSNPAGQTETPGGVARNVAESLARLGLPTELITSVGNDAAGQSLLSAATAIGLTTAGSLVASDAATGSYTALLDAQGQLLLALAAMPLADRLTPEFLAASQGRRKQAQLLVVDLNLPTESLALLLGEAYEQGKTLLALAVSEVKMERLPADLRGLQCLLLNGGELQAMFGNKLVQSEALAELHRRGVPQVLLTLGAAGVICSQQGSSVQLFPEQQPALIDVSGAGDAFAAGVCAGLYRQPQDLLQACSIGLRLAARTLHTMASVHPDLNPDWLEA